MTDKPKHVHKLKRLKYNSGNVIYFCTQPDCNHKIAVALALGKRCICWRCGNEFIMNEYSLRLAKPHCDNCHKNRIEDLDTSRVNVVDKTIEIDGTKHDMKPPVEFSLADRLSQTIKQAQPDEEDI